MPDTHGKLTLVLEKRLGNLRSDCQNCFGLCCVALYFSSTEGFPTDKDAGQPCINLKRDFRCCVHDSLSDQGLKGCLAFDCFGAGQKVAQVTFGGHDWRETPESAKQMFEVFLVMRQLHELLCYITEALLLPATCSIHETLYSMCDETERLTHLCPDVLQQLNVAEHRAAVNTLLLKTSEIVRAEARRKQKSHSGRQKAFGRRACLIATDLREIDLRGANFRGANLRGACLIAADIRGNELSGTDVIGADFRDADIRGADLSQSLFLTQAQINAANGDANTKIPSSLTRPMHWGALKIKSV